jgi:hypothetical protein
MADNELRLFGEPLSGPLPNIFQSGLSGIDFFANSTHLGNNPYWHNPQKYCRDYK